MQHLFNELAVNSLSDRSEHSENSDNFFSRHFKTALKNQNYLMLHTYIAPDHGY